LIDWDFVIDEALKRFEKEGKKAFYEYILEVLEKYNIEVKDEILEQIFNISSGSSAGSIDELYLSSLLYNNAVEVAQGAKLKLNEFMKSKATIDELALKLYDGYGFNDKEVLDVVKKFIS